MPEWTWYLLLIPAGFVAGVVNTIAGGGSFLTLPALMFLCGLPPQVANGSNRIAILLQSGYGTSLYRKAGHLDAPATMRLAVPMLLGTLGGAYMAAVMSPQLFRTAFGAIFLVMTVVLVLKRKVLLDAQDRERRPVAEWVAFVGLGVYAGFIQAGAGVLMLITFALLSGLDLARANGVKLALVTLVQVLALVVFVWNDQVDWIAGGVLALGNVLGTPVGAKLAMKKGSPLILGVVLVVMIATGVKLLVG